MADYAGAIEAIGQRFKDAWGDRTPIAVLNEKRPVLVDGNGDPASAWLFLEVVGAGSDIVGAGRPGDHRWVYDGLIQIHVFVRSGSGTADALRLATDAGEIFRAAEFYRVDDCCVRSWSPRIDGGDSGSDDGLWWRTTASIPFEYLHRG